MKPVFQIMPLAILLGGAFVAVWRGMDDPSSRKAKKNRRK